MAFGGLIHFAFWRLGGSTQRSGGCHVYSGGWAAVVDIIYQCPPISLADASLDPTYYWKPAPLDTLGFCAFASDDIASHFGREKGRERAEEARRSHRRRTKALR